MTSSYEPSASDPDFAGQPEEGDLRHPSDPLICRHLAGSLVDRESMAEEPNFIHEGYDGWLFLTAGSNNVISQFTRSRAMRKRIAAWARLLVAREKKCRQAGIRYLHVIVPEKLTVYDHKLAGLAVSIRLSPALRLRRRLFWRPRVRRACIDLVGPFRARRDEADLFHKTDSHWSFNGCQLAYEAICAHFGVHPPVDFGKRPYQDFERIGDLGTKLDPPRSEPSRNHQIQRDAQRIHASPIVLAREAAGQAVTLHVGSHVVYRNDAPEADPRRVVLFGDSYAHFAPIMLTIMLAETFREVHFIWSASVDWAYIDRVNPDLVITQMAERFMQNVPDDRFDLEAYAEERFGAELQTAPA